MHVPADTEGSGFQEDHRQISLDRQLELDSYLHLPKLSDEF